MIFEINKSLLIFFNNLSNYKIVENLVYTFSDFPIFFLPIFLIYMWIYYSFYKKDDDRKNNLLFIFYSTIIGILIALIIQNLVHIDRPEDYINSSSKLLLKHLPDASFPSDHATVSFAFLTSLFFSSYKKIAFIIMPFIILMNLSRIIAGVHWPFDILIGAFIGVLSSYIVFNYLKEIKFVKKLNFFIIKLMKYIKL